MIPRKCDTARFLEFWYSLLGDGSLPWLDIASIPDRHGDDYFVRRNVHRLERDGILEVRHVPSKKNKPKMVVRVKPNWREIIRNGEGQ